MKSVIKTIIISNIKKILYYIPKKNNQCVLLSSHIPVQNLGDQALLAGSIEGLSSYSKIYVIQTGSDSPKDAVDKLGLYSSYLKFNNRFRVVFASSNSFIETIYLLAFISRFESCYAIGADVLDGTYSSNEASRFFDVINDIAKCGVKVTIVGSSFSKNISKDVIYRIKKLDNRIDFYCRDLYSKKRINKFFPVMLSADAAFLMRPKKTFSAYKKIYAISNLKKQRAIIGLCIKKNDFKSNPELIKFCTMLSNLTIAGNLPSYIFLPHHADDFELCLTVRDQLNLENERTLMPDFLPAANEIKAVIQKCHVVVTGRMHIAIAALSSSVIPICFPYGDKFSGLLHHFNIESDDLIVGNDRLDTENIIEKCFINRHVLVRKINSNKLSVLNKAQLNFSYRRRR